MRCADCGKQIEGKGKVVERMDDKNYGAIPRRKAVVVCGKCCKLGGHENFKNSAGERGGCRDRERERKD